MKAQTPEIKQQMPAYPLLVKDPFFSVWSPSERLNESDTLFWTGKTRRIYGLVNADGVTYCFMGLVPKAQKLTQTGLKISAFSTDYTFTCDKFDLSVKFTSPLMPDDLKVLSCPVCYVDYCVTPKKPLDKVTVALYMHEESCYNRFKANVRGGVIDMPGYKTSWFGLKKQLVMSQSFDDAAAEWGYWYLAGKNAGIATQNMFDRFVADGSLDFMFERSMDMYICAYHEEQSVSSKLSGSFAVAFDDTLSIFYFGDWLKGYYFQGKTTILDALNDAIANKNEVLRKCEDFDKRLQKMAKPYGKDYLLVLYAALRQSVAGHKLVKDKDGNTLFLSKECHSNGCLCTVDVSYPSSPLFLLFNPELIEGMLRPIYEFARMPAWEFDFAPHDIGTYPYAYGQIYGLKREELITPTHFDRTHWKRSEFEPDDTATYPFFYMLPKGSDLYRFEMQMPVEECADMIIMAAAALKAGGNKQLVSDNYDLLSSWNDYLVKFGLIPEAQLCSDDGRGRQERNANLSAKAIVGIEAFAYLAEQLGNSDTAEKMHKTAVDYAAKWKQACFKKGYPSPLGFGDEFNGEFSLKYNMAFDVLFGTNLFDSEVRENETDCYIQKQERYGCPMDSVCGFVKTDWLAWSATLSDDIEKRKKLLAPIAKFIKETPDRYVFVDAYYAKDGSLIGKPNRYGIPVQGKNRTVQGGLFIPLLADSGILKLK